MTPIAQLLHDAAERIFGPYTTIGAGSGMCLAIVCEARQSGRRSLSGPAIELLTQWFCPDDPELVDWFWLPWFTRQQRDNARNDRVLILLMASVVAESEGV